MKTLINVTAQDISEGRRKDCKTCPIALAVRRIVKPECDVKVSTTYVGIHFNYEALKDDDSEIIKSFPDLPSNARTFIVRFDRELPVQPFAFELMILAKYLK